MRKEVILLCESFSTANYHVMINIIQSVDSDAHIHVIADTNENLKSKETWPCNITYYQVYNWQEAFLKRIKKIRPQILSIIIEYLFCRFKSHINNLCVAPYEKNSYRIAQKLIQDRGVKTVFSVCYRFYSHRIAMKLAGHYGIQWLQFWLDPFSNRYEKHSLFWKIEAEAIEKQFFKAVDKIYALPEVFIGNRPILPYMNKLVSFQIPYLINRNVKTTNKNIIFAGGFIKRIREPEPILDILLSVLPEIDKDINFYFYVQQKQKYQVYTKQSGGRIHFKDYVSHDILYKLLSECYMLLNIGNYGITQMPSKTVEYVSFRKPLLYFYNGENDSSLGYLKNYPDVCLIDVSENSEDNKNCLINFFTKDHLPIEYEELIKYQPFYISTPEYLKSIINIK